jgi:hypothetical protein
MAMRTGRPLSALMLTTEEHETPERWARRPETSQALARRARIILAPATGQPNGAIASALV